MCRLERIPVSRIETLKQTGDIRLQGWKRKKNNRIKEQEQSWLLGKSYFFSSDSQRKRRDEKERNRRINQDSVRQHYLKEISTFLIIYKEVCEILKQFIPNYTSVRYDNFDVEKSIARCFKYYLVEEDIATHTYTKHDFSVHITPEEYWTQQIKHVNSSTIQELSWNPIVCQLSPELLLYAGIDGTFTRWYCDRVFCRNLTETSHVFTYGYGENNITDKEVCDKVLFDFKEKSLDPKYNALFSMLRITKKRIDFAVQATLNERGREKEFQEWYKKYSTRFQNELNRLVYTIHDAYTILGVSHTDSMETIKLRFRQRLFETHPDHNPEKDTTACIHVIKAYEYIKQQRGIK